MIFHINIKKNIIFFMLLYAGANTQIFQASYMPPDLCQSVLHDPEKVLQSNAKHSNDFYKQRTGCFVHDIKAVYDMELKNPIFLLTECSKKTCYLDRSYNPQYRKIFQERFLQAVERRVKKKFSLHWVSFASGDLFQDLCIACKLLAEYPTLNLKLDLLDLKFEPLVTFLKDSKQGNTFNLDECSKILGSTTTTYGIEIWCKYLLLRQFYLFLKRYFPAATLSINVYDKVDSYVKHMNNQNSVPHMVTAADLIHCFNMKIEDYEELCFEILYRNPNVSNVCLDTINGTIYLLKATLNKKNSLVFNEECID